MKYIFPKILIESIDTQDDTTSADVVLFNPLLLSNIITEYVNQDDLSVIPKKIHNFICSKLDVKNESKFIISYKELADLISNSTFKLMLEEYSVYDSGFLTIGICKHDYNVFLRIFESKYMDKERIQRFYNMCQDGMTGLTLSMDPLLFSKMKNVCIWLNLDAIKSNSSWKDTLSHELSHFVQRVINASDKQLKNFDKILLKNQHNGTLQYSSAALTNDSFEQLKDFCEKRFPFHSSMFHEYFLIYANMLAQTFKITELKTTTQNILNGFQRMFEQQKFKKQKRTYKNIDNSIETRLKWLNSLLNKINNEAFFHSNTGKNILEQLYSSSYSKLTKDFETQMRFKNSILVLQYLGIKILKPEIQIDERLKNHFKIFKFRDN